MMNPIIPLKINSVNEAGAPFRTFLVELKSSPSFSFLFSSSERVYAARRKEMATKNPKDCIGSGILIPKMSFRRSDMVGYNG